jgi:hypothetical protein
MENTFEIVETSSSSEESETETDQIIQPTKFLNEFPVKEYEKNRNEIFTKNIVRKKIVIDSQNYYQGSNFNTSNYRVVFDFETSAGTSLVTTNYGMFKNVIGFRMTRASIRVPSYNINETNNKIVYKVGDALGTGDLEAVWNDGTIYTVTINPGVYNAHELAAVFQKYEQSHTGELDGSGDPITMTTSATYAQFCIYSTNPGTGTYSSPTFTPATGSFSGKFIETDSTTLFSDAAGGYVSRSDSLDYMRGSSFELEYNDGSSKDVIIIWDYDNITRGAAKLFGFQPKVSLTNSTGGTFENKAAIFSNKMPDLSSQYVDLVCPEIPSIGCKRNSFGKEIIERIQLNTGHGEYIHYDAPRDESQVQNYFSPIRLHRLTIQLYASNNEFYDTQNSDNSFEFEITMVKNKRLLA